MLQSSRASGGLPPTAACLAVLLLLVAACSSPAQAAASDSPQSAAQSHKTGTVPRSDQCAVVAGQTTTECRPGCQVCRAPTGKVGTRRWVPPERRACVCCEPGRIPHDTNPSKCKVCPLGSIAPAAGLLKCDKCSEGSTTPNAPITRTACSVCKPGRAGPNCDKCPPNTWSPGGDAASVVCTGCPAGTQSPVGAKSEQACKRKGTKCPSPNPCKRIANSNGTCTNVPGIGFECACNPGYIWSNGACQEVITCSRSPCSNVVNGDGTCKNIVDAWNEVAYECGCKPGYVWAGNGVCQDEAGCNGDPCSIWADQSRSCTDLQPPESGYECGCSTGYVWVNNECKDEDGCAAGDPCGLTTDQGRTCTDAAAPNTGAFCGCKPAYYRDGDSCKAKLLCGATDKYNCPTMANSNGTCLEYPSTVPDFNITECTCNKGYYWNVLTEKCEENPGCDRATNPCTGVANSDATCTDAFNSVFWQPWELGYKCGCNPGYLWNPRASGSISNYVGACQANPGGCNPATNPCAGVANSNGGCTDVASQTGAFFIPTLAYRCTCNTGFFWYTAAEFDSNSNSLVTVGKCRAIRS